MSALAFTLGSPCMRTKTSADCGDLPNVAWQIEARRVLCCRRHTDKLSRTTPMSGIILRIGACSTKDHRNGTKCSGEQRGGLCVTHRSSSGTRVATFESLPGDHLRAYEAEELRIDVGHGKNLLRRGIGWRKERSTKGVVTPASPDSESKVSPPARSSQIGD